MIFLNLFNFSFPPIMKFINTTQGTVIIPVYHCINQMWLPEMFFNKSYYLWYNMETEIKCAISIHSFISKLRDRQRYGQILI